MANGVGVKKMVEKFRVRVIQLLQRQGWEVKDAPRSSPVDIIATREGGGIRAFIVKAHGHITRNKITAIHEYERVHHISTVYVSESGERELSFRRLYKHLKRG
jgi:hypothetical protein